MHMTKYVMLLLAKEDNLVPNLSKPIFLITGSSGVGKNAVIDELIRQHSSLIQVVSATTRWPARNGEQFGKSYYFVSQECFAWLKSTDQLIESTLVYGNHYGTLAYSLEAAQALNKTPILTVDPSGATSYLHLGYNVRIIFLDFPNTQAQKERILHRQPDISPQALDERLAQVAQERAWANTMSQQPNFTIVVNDKLGICVQDSAQALGL